MKKYTPEQIIKKCNEQIRKEISHWKKINLNGCNDPFWTDGCNMNLVRNHIIYYKNKLREICEENQTALPEEYYYSLPPEVDNNYMANLKQKDRIAQIFHDGHIPVRKNYCYNERQMCLF